MNLTDLAEEVAPRLLGATLTHETAEGTVSIAITETEAYSGAADPASHAYRGKTERNAVMFGPAGHLYVYRSHGLHWCANIVTGTDGIASAVLIRAGRVVEGEELARERRGDRADGPRLARGPGNLCRALGITAEQNGVDVLTGTRVKLSEGRPPDPAHVRSGPRVGVSRAHDWQHRFYLVNDPTVSAYRLSPRARPHKET
ncbi:DNA-3-methyladenine glycosylase [Streptomyces sp. NPDC059166]|uniref:DNA-3-methyladenine glycosylase n=1 Tax=Streptomyces sp. NPDC059166 TaxID=3346752 RepID=UPI003693E87E